MKNKKVLIVILALTAILVISFFYNEGTDMTPSDFIDGQNNLNENIL